MSEKPISKSKRVQQYLQEHPRARNRDVVDALKPHGVTAADVSNAKAHLKRKVARRQSVSAAAATTTLEELGDSQSISLGDLETTIEFIQRVGSIQRARQLLAIVQQIREVPTEPPEP
jgi:hypothetical protein